MTTQPQHSVFIADDDEDDRLLLQLAFAQHSPECNLIFTEDGLTLLEALAQEPAEPCLIILDLNMPRLNGFEALQQLRHSPLYASVPVVILTTSTQAADRKQAFGLGASEFLTKPLNLTSLGQLVVHLRQQWHLEECL